MEKSVHEFKAIDINGNEISLAEYEGKKLLIVNTAGKCGFTPQYKGLQELRDKYAGDNFEILGFPCNQFGGQEPGSEEEIKQFCDLNYGVKFPMFSKIEVNGEGAHPLFKFLKKSAPGILSKKIKWNFTKFLVDENGKVIKRYAPSTTPEKIGRDLGAM